MRVELMVPMFYALELTFPIFYVFLVGMNESHTK
jgi:hypothetical protein